MSPLLEVTALAKSFGGGLFGGAPTRAVDGVSFAILPQQTAALIGESGCGKTTLGRIVAGLLAPDAGEVRWTGKVEIEAGRAARTGYWDAVQMVFQDPAASLSPRRRVGQIVAEPLRLRRRLAAAAVRLEQESLLAAVGLDPGVAARFPHQLSGGQKQRVSIARAIACGPGLIVCDEPTSALDVSVQAQVLNLLLDLQSRRGLSLLFITHDFAVAQYVSDRLMVMYAGRIVEQGATREVFTAPRHPYTRRLLESVPGRWSGSVSAPLRPPVGTGCAYAGNCARASATCAAAPPALSPAGAAHAVACFHPEAGPDAR